MYIKFILFAALSISQANAESIGNTSGSGSGNSEATASPAAVSPLLKDPSCHMPQPEENGPGDQPGACRVQGGTPTQGENFEKSVQGWHSIQDMNNWIGKNFQYDRERMAKFGANVPESERGQVYTPDQLLAGRSGVCFDLSRFAYEAISNMSVSPKVENLKYTKINFDPAVINGATIRMHWMVEYQIDGKYYFTADSRCPGRTYGPYDSIEKFQECYSAFRGRKIEDIQLVDSYKKSPRQRKLRDSRKH